MDLYGIMQSGKSLPRNEKLKGYLKREIIYVGSNISLPSTLILEAVLFLHSVKLPTKGTQLQIEGGLFHYNFIACLQYLLLLSHYVFVIVISYFECSQFATNTGEMQIRVVLAVVVGHGGIFSPINLLWTTC